MTELTLREQIHAALVELGNTADQVAEKLFGLGVRGRRGEECACPLFNYLADRFPGQIEGIAMGAVYLVGAPDVDLTEAADEFVVAFDGGRYDELVVE